MSLISVAIAVSLAGASFGDAEPCPELETHVAQLRHSISAETFKRLSIERRAELLMVSLEGAPATRRSLPLSASCDELSQAVAVIAASWDATLALPPTPPMRVVAPAPKPPTLQLGLGVAGGLTMALQSPSVVSADVHVTASLGLTGRPMAALLALNLPVTEREEHLAPGEVRWRRFSLGVGLRYRVFDRTLKVDLLGQVLAGLVSVRGTGFDANAGQLGFDLGATTGARMAIQFTQVALWVGLEARFWALPQQVRAHNVSGLTVLPWFEPAVTAGVSWVSL